MNYAGVSGNLNHSLAACEWNNEKESLDRRSLKTTSFMSLMILTDITVVKVDGTPSYSLTETSDRLPSKNKKNTRSVTPINGLNY